MDDPLTKWLHLHSNINNTAGTVSAKKYISVLNTIAFVVSFAVITLLWAVFYWYYERNVLPFFCYCAIGTEYGIADARPVGEFPEITKRF